MGERTATHKARSAHISSPAVAHNVPEIQVLGKDSLSLRSGIPGAISGYSRRGESKKNHALQVEILLPMEVLPWIQATDSSFKVLDVDSFIIPRHWMTHLEWKLNGGDRTSSADSQKMCKKSCQKIKSISHTISRYKSTAIWTIKRFPEKIIKS